MSRPFSETIPAVPELAEARRLSGPTERAGGCIIQASWPAPPAASLWNLAPLVPGGRCISQPARATAPRPKATAPKATARRPSQAGPDTIEGTAMTFGTFFSPGTKLGGRPAAEGTRVLVNSGALDRVLRAIAAGYEVVPLTLGHDGMTLATTRDALSLFIVGDCLRIRLCRNSAAGRFALRHIQARGWTDLSCSLESSVYLPLHRYEIPTFKMLFVERIIEIAVVDRGACPDCRLLLS
jgi:hypothetical protein